MAALAASAATPYGGNTNLSSAEFLINQAQLEVRRLKLVLTGQGGLTNTIGAHALGFELLVWCSGLVDTAGSKGYLAVVDPTLNIVVLYDGAAAPAPVDVTSTASYIVVVGVPRITPSLT